MYGNNGNSRVYIYMCVCIYICRKMKKFDRQCATLIITSRGQHRPAAANSTLDHMGIL